MHPPSKDRRRCVAPARAEAARATAERLRVVAVACANGLGHFRRVVGIVDRLRRARPCEVTLVCEGWQVRRMSGWWRLRELLEAGARVREGVMLPGVRWSGDPAVYGDGRLLDWVERLSAVEELGAADLVLSDNLPGVLELRPDAVLSGSFLWSDVLGEVYGDEPAVAELVRRDRELLARHRPPMLCVGEMAMPGVLERASAVPLPWMCEDDAPAAEAGASIDARPRGARPRGARPKGARPRVAVLGGATGAAGDLLTAAVGELADEACWEIAAAPGLAGEGDVVRFGFTGADYAACAAAVCRPGMGTLSDCLAHRVPVAALYEPRNLELRHNGRRIEALGLGIDCGSQPGAARRAVAELLAPARSRQVMVQMAARPRGGLERAAAWLSERVAAPAEARA